MRQQRQSQPREHKKPAQERVPKTGPKFVVPKFKELPDLVPRPCPYKHSTTIYCPQCDGMLGFDEKD